MKRTALYARVSTGDQQVENQIRQLRAYAATQQWEVVAEIVDIESGGKGAKERDGLARLLGLCRQRSVDVVLFWSLDRLSREGSRMTIHYLTLFDDAGVGWHSFTEPYISSLGLFADAIVAILGALAKQERVRLSERTKAGLQRAAAMGKRIGRPQTPLAVVAEAKRLRGEGLSFSDIGGRLGLSRSRAHQLIQMA